MRIAVVILAAATGLNIVLDPIFIYFLGWGVPGAAWATLVAMLASFVAYFVFLFVRRASYVSFSPRFFRPSWSVLRDIFKVGIPASIILMIVTGFAVYVLWPIMGMPITTGG